MQLAATYKNLIDAIVVWSGSGALMHVHAGLAIYLLTQVVVRHRRSWIIGLNLVFACELANEVVEWFAPVTYWTLHDTLIDVLFTMMWPVAIAAVTQYRRRRWVGTTTPATRRHVSIAPSTIA